MMDTAESVVRFHLIDERWSMPLIYQKSTRSIEIRLLNKNKQ